MTERPMGLLDALGEICEIMASEGCSWDEASIRRQQKHIEEWESNVVYVDFRARAPGGDAA
jgi:hypothetical protein